MSDRVIVKVDQELSGLIPGFIAHKREDLYAILDAGARADFETVARLAHRLRGEGASYGFEAMSELGRDLEAAGVGGDGAAAAGLARQLLGYLDRVEIVYQESSD